MSRRMVRPARASLVLQVTLSAFILPPTVAASEIAFSTFLAGSRSDRGTAIAPTPDGGVVVVGGTGSRDFPTYRALQSERRGQTDAFVVKLDGTGSRIEFATFLGGSHRDEATAVAVDPAGNIYVGGSTLSRDFPAVRPLDYAHAYPHSERVVVTDGFLTKLSPDGQEILFSSSLGGEYDDWISALDIEGDGRVFVAGGTDSTDFPGLPAVSRLTDVFVAWIDTEASRLIAARSFGGSFNYDWADRLVWDPERRALWVAGEANAHDFPQVRPIREGAKAENGSGFVARLLVSADSLRLKSASVLPTYVAALAVDAKGRAHVAFSFKLHAYLRDRALEGWEDMQDRCPKASIYLRLSAGGRGLKKVECLPTIVSELAVDREGRLVVVGEGGRGLPLVDPVQTARDDGYGKQGWDLYFAVLAGGAVRVRSATYLGGREKDAVKGLSLSRSGKRVFLTGITRSDDFPLVSPVQAEKPGTFDSTGGAFVTELRPYR